MQGSTAAKPTTVTKQLVRESDESEEASAPASGRQQEAQYIDEYYMAKQNKKVRGKTQRIKKFADDETSSNME